MPANLSIERASRHQYIREMTSKSGKRQIFRARLASHLVNHHLEGDLLALGQPRKTGALDRADVHKHVIAAVGGLDETEALLAVEPLHSTCCHSLLQSAHAHSSRGCRTNQFNVDDVSEKGARRRIQQGTAANRTPSKLYGFECFTSAASHLLRTREVSFWPKAAIGKGDPDVGF
jgi:hypothetical protein